MLFLTISRAFKDTASPIEKLEISVYLGERKDKENLIRLHSVIFFSYQDVDRNTYRTEEHYVLNISQVWDDKYHCFLLCVGSRFKMRVGMPESREGTVNEDGDKDVNGRRFGGNKG